MSDTPSDPGADPRPPSRRHLVVAAGVLTVLAIAGTAATLRLGRPSFQLDESATWYNLSGDWDHFWDQATHGHDCGGFAYGALLKLVADRAGHDEGTLRLPGALLGVLAIGGLMGAGAVLGGTRVALAAGTLATVHPAIVGAIRQARAYPLLMLGTSLGLWALAAHARRPGIGPSLLFGVAAWIAVTSHGLGVAVVGALLAAGLVLDATDGRRIGRRARLRSWLPLFTCAIPVVVWAVLRWPVRAWLDRFWSVGSPVDAVRDVASAVLVEVPVGAGLLVLAALVALVRPVGAGRRGLLALTVFAVVAGLAPFALTWLASGETHFILPRYFLPVTAVATLAAGTLIGRLPPLAMAGVLAGILVGAAHAAKPWYDVGAPTGTHARDACRYLRDRVGPNDKVFVTPANELLTLRYYGVDAELVPIRGEDGEAPYLALDAELRARPDLDCWGVFFHWHDDAGLDGILERFPRKRFGKVCLFAIRSDRAPPPGDSSGR